MHGGASDFNLGRELSELAELRRLLRHAIENARTTLGEMESTRRRLADRAKRASSC
jgi:hypothetical protein